MVCSSSHHLNLGDQIHADDDDEQDDACKREDDAPEITDNHLLRPDRSAESAGAAGAAGAPGWQKQSARQVLDGRWAALQPALEL